MHHLNVRVAWHDNEWNGTICRRPSDNSFCIDLDRIRAERDDQAETILAGRHFADLSSRQHPACKAESGAFMNSRQWIREFNHPYQALKKTQATHGQLKSTCVKIEPYSTFAVPFLWMLREQQETITNSLPQLLPPDEDPPFNSPWVFSKARQEALCELFFGKLEPGKSLAFFYTKTGHPLGEAISRLVVGVGTIEWISDLLRYESKTSSTFPMWDRMFRHSIRPEGSNGFLIPYHAYLTPTGDEGEDRNRRDLLREIAVVPEESQMAEFSFAGELSTDDVALSVLLKCLEVTRKIRTHGISKGPWEQREEWLNQRIAETWRERGAFPGAGAALEALGMRLGTSLVLDLHSRGVIKPTDDPWPTLNNIIRNSMASPHRSYQADINAIAPVWANLPEERRNLLKLLSRFDLSTVQASRWFDPVKRKKATLSDISDRMILNNPYRIAETDLGDPDDHPVSIGVVDRGLLPDSTIAAIHPLPEASTVESTLDRRRVRAALVTVLRKASQNGDALLSEAEACTLLSKLDLPHPCVVPADWLRTFREFLSEEIKSLEIVKADEGDLSISCLQLSALNDREQKLASILSKRCATIVPSLKEQWRELLVESVKEGGGIIESDNPRHDAALKEQAEALERVTTRRLTALVGRAGTGKTTVLGALLKSRPIQQGGVLFLAPTGKARVRLSQKANAEAMTVAQFLYGLGRYDGWRQRPLFIGKEQYRKERTVVVDESSMLTLDDLCAVLLALDLAHVQRVILVGDPNQLPPIGVGRPFADLVAELDESKNDASALARLTVELRTTAGAPSDSLKLASWYTREAQPIDADRVLSDLELGQTFNDLTVRFWETSDQLMHLFEEEFIARFELTDKSDISGFNQRAMGLTSEGWVPFDDHDGAELFQILSPVRLHPYGVHDINRWVQKTFRAKQLESARQPWGLSLGDEEIVWGDKVILVRNGKRSGWNGKNKAKVEDYLANGEIGVAAPPPASTKGFLNVAFARRPDVRFGFSPKQFGADRPPLELAYALTVHKAQGSEFGTVFVVLPKHSRLMSRELLYTALTRAREHLILLIEGRDASGLYDLTRPERSETARRNTNMFAGTVRRQMDETPYASRLVHRARNGEMVRSKSELVIANHLFDVNIKYVYERPLEGIAAPGRFRPDFSFITDAGDVIIWEHLGMLNQDDYRRGWEWKQAWYRQNGFNLGENLFTTQDDEQGGLDTGPIEKTAECIRKLL